MEINALSDHHAEDSDENLPNDNFYTPSNREFYISNPYSNLDFSKHEIRLLELLPAKRDEPLSTKLGTPYLLTSGSTPSYCAISYFAGDHKETEVIFVNGIRFNAFANLVRALRQIVQAKERGDLKEYP